MGARGKRRLHQRPRGGEVDACVSWLMAELNLVKPAIISVGATAARAIPASCALKRCTRAANRRALWPRTFVTIHPSALLRLTVPAERQAAFDAFVADLAKRDCKNQGEVPKGNSRSCRCPFSPRRIDSLQQGALAQRIEKMERRCSTDF